MQGIVARCLSEQAETKSPAPMPVFDHDQSPRVNTNRLLRSRAYRCRKMRRQLRDMARSGAARQGNGSLGFKCRKMRQRSATAAGSSITLLSRASSVHPLRRIHVGGHFPPQFLRRQHFAPPPPSPEPTDSRRLTSCGIGFLDGIRSGADGLPAGIPDCTSCFPFGFVGCAVFHPGVFILLQNGLIVLPSGDVSFPARLRISPWRRSGCDPEPAPATPRLIFSQDKIDVNA